MLLLFATNPGGTLVLKGSPNDAPPAVLGNPYYYVYKKRRRIR